LSKQEKLWATTDSLMIEKMFSSRNKWKGPIHMVVKKRKHTLKYQAISPAVILQKAVVDFGGLKKNYLGPQETKNKNIYI
jgi:hypothetical protein